LEIKNWLSLQAICVESIADMRYTAKKMLQHRCVIYRVTLFFRFLRPRLVITIAPVVLCLVPITPLRAQERVRTAAQQLEIESFRKPEVFVRLGPLQEELIASTGVDFTDNSDLTHSNKISRLSFFEALGLNTTWVLSHLNELKFNFGGKLTEDFFGNGKSEINVGISPDSLVQLQFAISDFRFRFYDQFSYIQDPSSSPTATNTTYLNSLTNTIGTVVDADFNLVILSLSADYTYNNQSGANSQGQNNPSTSGSRNSFRVGSSVAFRLWPTILYGIEDSVTRSTGSSGGTGSGTGSKSSGSGNVNSLNVGPFARGKLSRLTDFDLSVGATLVDAKPSIAPGYYFSAVIRHQFNRNLQLILTGSHELIFTTGTDLTEETILRAATQFNVTRFITFTAAPSVTFGDVKSGPTMGNLQTVSGALQGNFKEYVMEASLGWKPRKHLSAALTYDFRRRDGASAAGTYTQNTLGFEIKYAF
jgi:hypothetical protein